MIILKILLRLIHFIGVITLLPMLVYYLLTGCDPIFGVHDWIDDL